MSGATVTMRADPGRRWWHWWLPPDPPPPGPRGGPRPTGLAATDVPRYPPVDPGLPAVPVDDVLASQAGFIDRLRQASGLDRIEAEWHVAGPVRALARHVHLLPASADAHFAGAGGLFRLGLEVAWHTRQAAAARRLPGAPSADQRRHHEPRWRHTCLLAGLFADVAPTLAALAIADDAGRVWPTHLGPLADWLVARDTDRYHPTWLGGPGAASVGAMPLTLAALVPAATLAWLDDGGTGYSRLLSAAVHGVGIGDAAHVVAMVAAARCRVLAADAATRASRYGRLRVGHHLEVHLLDAIRARIAAGTWGCGRSPLWYGWDGLYLEWPAAAAVVCDDLHRHGLRGVPRCAFTLAEVLGRAGVLVPSAPDPWLWRLDTAGARAAGSDLTVNAAALKFADPRTVLGYVAVEPEARTLAARPPDAGVGEEMRGRAGNGAPPPGRGAGRAPDAAADAVPGAGDAPAADAPADLDEPPVATPAGPALSDDDRRMFDTWRTCADQHRGDLVAWLPGRGLAVSQDVLALTGHQLATVATRLHRRRWLGRGDWPSPDARAGLLPFDGATKPGLVLNDVGLRALGWGRPVR